MGGEGGESSELLRVSAADESSASATDTNKHYSFATRSVKKRRQANIEQIKIGRSSV